MPQQGTLEDLSGVVNRINACGESVRPSERLGSNSMKQEPGFITKGMICENGLRQLGS